MDTESIHKDDAFISNYITSLNLNDELHNELLTNFIKNMLKLLKERPNHQSHNLSSQVVMNLTIGLLDHLGEEVLLKVLDHFYDVYTKECLLYNTPVTTIEMLGKAYQLLSSIIQFIGKTKQRKAIDQITNAYAIRSKMISDERNLYMGIYETIPLPILILNKHNQIDLVNIAGINLLDELKELKRGNQFSLDFNEIFSLQELLDDPYKESLTVPFTDSQYAKKLTICKFNWNSSATGRLLIIGTN